MECIEDYGLIGNQRSSALVSHLGSIDFFCAPHFDSPTIFARLLDKRGGHFSISPLNPDEEHGRTFYFPDACVIITRFNHNGVSEVWDFMPLSQNLGHAPIIRRLKGVKGNSELMLELCPRFNYALDSHTTEPIHGGFKISTKAQTLYFYCTNQGEMSLQGNDLRCKLCVEANECEYFLLTDKCLLDEEVNNLAHLIEEELEDSIEKCREWVGQSNYRGRWQENVNRSALTLKLLISKEKGAQVAAPTFSLPESIGGEHNWDYRYVWIRDNCFTFIQLMRLGFKEDAKNFMKWLVPILQKNKGERAICPLYNLDGSPQTTERELTHFSGYKDSKPVRIGNGAWEQLQLDVYGELLSFLNLYDEHVELLTIEELGLVKNCLEWLRHNWKTKDKGIWERRDSARIHLFSLAMCWFAFDHAMLLYSRRSHPAPLDTWRKTRDEIFDYIHANLWSDEQESYIHAKGEDRIDASALIIPLVGLCGPRDPCWIKTVSKIEETLLEDNFIHRYSSETKKSSYRSDEGTFSLCTFWYAECLAKQGQSKRGRYIFERMLSFSSVLGLYSEEVGIEGHHLGNFPQALTHAALISCALTLDDYESNFMAKEDSNAKANPEKKDSDRYWSLSGGRSSARS